MKTLKPAGLGVGLLLAIISLIYATPQNEPAPADVRPGGTIEGRIFFEGTPPDAEKIRITKDPLICGSSQESEEFVVSPDNKGLKNVVVLVVGVEDSPEPEAISVEQRKCAYVPHLQVATVGTSLALTNHDPTLHNVHAFLVRDNGSERTAFNLAQPAPKDPAAPKSIKRTLRRPGVYRIECDVHPWMRAYVVVHDNPYHATSDENGHYAITGVPVGTHTVRIWHEGLGMVEKTVTVTEGGSVSLDLPIAANE